MSVKKDKADNSYTDAWTEGNIGATFFVSTTQGYWGKGKSLREAVTNANVTNDIVKGCIFRIPNVFVEEIHSTHGGCGWTWTQETMDSLTESQRDHLANIFDLGNGATEIRKIRSTGKVHIIH